MIVCKICKINKPENLFYFRKDSSSYRTECKDCIKQSRKDYQKINRDKISKRRKILKTSNPEKYKKTSRDWENKNREKRRAQSRKLRDSNIEKYRQKDRERYIKDREKRKICVKNTYQKNKDAYKIMSATRRFRKRKAQPKWLTEDQKLEIKRIYEKSYELQKTTGQKYHVDHIIPLNGKEVCGLHVPWNLQVITAEENMKKHNKLIQEYLNDNNRPIGETESR